MQEFKHQISQITVPQLSPFLNFSSPSIINQSKAMWKSEKEHFSPKLLSVHFYSAGRKCSWVTIAHETPSLLNNNCGL